MELVGVVSKLFRYGVKSMQGQELDRAEVTWTGIVGDRRWVVRDEQGRVLTGKISAGAKLLECMAVGDPDGYHVFMPDKSLHACGSIEASMALAGLLDQEVYMSDVTAAVQHIPVRFRPAFELRPGVGADSSPLHLLTTATLGTLGTKAPGSLFIPERFRPNVMIMPTHEGEYPEDSWVGRRLRIGQTTLYVRKRTVRCAMTTQAQPVFGGIGRDPEILRAITREHNKDAGIYATVISPGAIQLGDEVMLLDAEDM